MKKRIILSSILAIAMCVSVAIGATFALFTSTKSVNIAVTSGKVEVVANIDDASVKTYSMGVAQTAGNFANGGKAEVSDGSVSLNNVTPGDKVAFQIKVTDQSTVKAQYRTKWFTESDNGLLDALTVFVDGVAYDGTTTFTDWEQLDFDEKTIGVEILLNETAGSEYQNKSCTLTFTVEAVQFNAETVNPEAGVTFIYNKTDLKNFRNRVNNGENFSKKTVKLMEDVDLSGTEWTPIGKNGAAFDGTFDGNGKTISNLKVNGVDFSGLFGVMHGIVKNLTVDGADVTGNHYCGVIAAYSTANAGGIDNCAVNNATVFTTPSYDETTGEYDNGDKAGGIIGYISYGSFITNCSVNNVTVRGYRDLGGVVGCALGNGYGLTVTNNRISNITVIQDNTNAYKTGPITTYGAVAGRYDAETDMSDNVQEEVSSKSMASSGFYSVTDAATASDTGVYEIYDAAGLLYWNKLVKSKKSFKNATVKLMADIDLSGELWEPLNLKGIAGNFTLDGNGYAVKNMKVRSCTAPGTPGDSGDYGFAFIGDCSGDITVKNITFDGADVSSRYDGNLYYGNVGGVVMGYTYGTTLFDNVKVVNSTLSGFGKIGFLLGMGATSGVKVTFKNCVSKDNVLYATYNAGGLAGNIQRNNTTNADNTTVENCTVENIDLHIGEVNKYNGIYELENVTVTCDGSKPTCAKHSDRVIAGRYICYYGFGTPYYFGCYAKYYVSYGNGSHDCTATWNGNNINIANSEICVDA